MTAESQFLSPGHAIAVVGPTAIGKTAVALEIVRLLKDRSEILSVDSVQVYKRLDIGSAKPAARERASGAFHLIDLIEPDQAFTLADYQQQAIAARDEVARRGNALILAGGTGLYFRSLTQPLGLPEVPPDEELRASLLGEAQVGGPGELHRKLVALDINAASRIHPNDTKRLIRALEVIHHTQGKLSDLHRRDAESGEPLIACSHAFALNCERAMLYERIERRVDQMMANGFLAEVLALREAGYAPALRPMQTLGYKELNAHIDGELGLEQAVALIKQHTRQYARRQLIWFRADPRLAWIDAPPGRPAAEIAAEILDRVSHDQLGLRVK